MILSSYIVAQNLDSLYQNYRHKTAAKEKTVALMQYAEGLLRYDIDSSFNSSKIALKQAEKLKEANLIADANFQMGFCVQARGNYKEALQYLLKATDIYQKQNNKIKIREIRVDPRLTSSNL